MSDSTDRAKLLAALETFKGDIAVATEQLVSSFSLAAFEHSEVTDHTLYRSLGLTQPMAFLVRNPSSSEGTFGKLHCCWGEEHCEFHTLEPPWKENRRDVSCIPAENYRCQYEKTNKRIGGEDHWYHVLDVEGRGSILIHPGNWAGDESLGKYTDSHGCILLGLGVQQMRAPQVGSVSEDGAQSQPQLAVTSSRTACRRLANFFDQEPFELRIYDD